MKKYIILLLLTISISANITAQDIKPGSYQISKYSNLLEGKKIGIVANQSSEINGISLVDTLISLNNNIVKIFSPEHGFRGKADAGAKIEDEIDFKTGLKVISLYGNNKKPKDEQLKGIDIMLFDLQDVGVRFYTYISTLHYVMEACAENNIPVIILDRPNPNAHYVDGPMLEEKYKSFVGMHKVPIVYVKISNYNHTVKYNLPVRPSPNLPNEKSINLYPSLCYFEGTPISAGRGTEMQFQIFGAPELKDMNFNFTPQPNFGSKKPKFKGEKCYGRDLRDEDYLSEINISWVIEAFNSYPNKDKFFNNFFKKLAGTKKLQQQIINGKSAKEIKDSWQAGLDDFKKVRAKYLLYK